MGELEEEGMKVKGGYVGRRMEEGFRVQKITLIAFPFLQQQKHCPISLLPSQDRP